MKRPINVECFYQCARVTTTLLFSIQEEKLQLERCLETTQQANSQVCEQYKVEMEKIRKEMESTAAEASHHKVIFCSGCSSSIPRRLYIFIKLYTDKIN